MMLIWHRWNRRIRRQIRRWARRTFWGREHRWYLRVRSEEAKWTVQTIGRQDRIHRNSRRLIRVARQWGII